MFKKSLRAISVMPVLFVGLSLGVTACAGTSQSKRMRETQVGSAHLKRGHEELAERNFRSVLAQDPNNTGARYELGRMEALRGNAKEAKRHFQAVIAREPYNASAHVNLGWSLVELNKINEAERHFERALELEDEEASAQAGMGAVCLARHQPNRAKAYFDKALSIDPNHSVTHYYLGEYFQYTGDLSRAIKHYKHCATNESKMQSRAYYKLACCYAELKKKDASLNALRQAARYGFKDYAEVMRDARFKNYRQDINKMFKSQDVRNISR